MSRQRQPLAPIALTYPSTPPSPVSLPLSASTTHKRPAAAVALTGQGRRKTSRTEKGATITSNVEADTSEALADEERDQDRDQDQPEAGPSRLAYQHKTSPRPMRPAASTSRLTPRVRAILDRDDIGTKQSPARKLFAAELEMLESVSKGKTPGISGRLSPPRSPIQTSSSLQVLAPSPPLFSSSSATNNTQVSIETHRLPPGLTEPDHNGVCRSIHDPGFSVLTDPASISALATSTILISTPTPSDRSNTPSTTRSEPATPSKWDDKENVPPPRLASSASATPKTSGSTYDLLAPGSGKTVRAGSHDAVWSNTSSIEVAPCSATPISIAQSQTHAQSSTTFTSCLTARAENTSEPSSSSLPTPHATPSKVRVKSKLAEEIVFSPTYEKSFEEVMGSVVHVGSNKKVGHQQNTNTLRGLGLRGKKERSGSVSSVATTRSNGSGVAAGSGAVAGSGSGVGVGAMAGPITRQRAKMIR